MQWHYVFVIGAITGMLALLLMSGDSTAVAVQLPGIHWSLATMKYILSLFIATVLMMLVFWIYA